MKKDYNTKKKMMIGGLSLVAVCLVVGLLYFSGAAGRQAKTPATTSSTSSEPEVVVPETTQPEATLPEESGTTGKDTISSSQSETSAAPASSAAQSQTQSKPSDGKPKTRSEATPPATAPDKSSGSSSKGSTKQNQPQGGEKRSDGAVYVPGFGWVENSGEQNRTESAPNAGTGDPVGDM